jgi:polyadenylate-binding protein
VQAINGMEINGKTIFAGRAQKKCERQAELKERFDKYKVDRVSRLQVNVTFSLTKKNQNK